MASVNKVKEAEAALNAATELVAAARGKLQAAEALVSDCYQAITAARIEADSALPQCELWEVNRYSAKEEMVSRQVIVRQTPTGILVARLVGEAAGGETKYEFWKHSGKFLPKKTDGFQSLRTYELRNVPAQFIPTT